MPVWTPGAYELRTWGRNVTPLGASDGNGRALRDHAHRAEPLSRRRRRRGGGAVRVRYRVYAAKLTDDGSHIDGGHALLNGSSLFLAARGQERGPHTVHVALPAGWRAATALDEDAGGWTAPSYEALIDAPIECGRFADATVRAAGRSYRIVVDGARAACRRASSTTWPGWPRPRRASPAPPPYRRYVVIVHLGRRGRAHRRARARGVDVDRGAAASRSPTATPTTS